MIIHWWELLTIVLGSALVSSFLVFFLVSRYFTQRANSIFNAVKLYFEPSTDDGISEFGKFIDAVGKSISGNLIASFKGQAMGEASGEAKRERLVEQAMAKDQLDQLNPLLSLATDATPALKKLFNKNPMSLITAARMFKGSNFGLQTKGTGNGSKVNISKIGG